MEYEAELQGHSVVIQPDEGTSIWQPLPANGHADPKLIPEFTQFEGFSMGFQTIAPHCHVLEHAHDVKIELLIGFQGEGRVVVDGVDHPFLPGTCCFLGYDVKHKIINDSDEDFVMMWLMAPAGLEKFFGTIGRPRERGSAAPEPFERGEDKPLHG